MRVSAIGLVLLVCAVVLISGVSAQNVDKNAGYSVAPVGNLVLPRTMQPHDRWSDYTGTEQLVLLCYSFRKDIDDNRSQLGGHLGFNCTHDLRS